MMQEGKIGEAAKGGSRFGKRLKISSETMTTKGISIDK